MSELTNDEVADHLQDMVSEWLQQAGYLYSYVVKHEAMFDHFKTTLLWHTIKSVAQGQETLYQSLITIEDDNARNDDNAS